VLSIPRRALLARGAMMAAGASVAPGFARPLPAQGLDATVRYVHRNGNDANDGLSWETAKRTVRAAYQALPQFPEGGTIRVGGSRVEAGAGGGLWFADGLMLSSLPAGFLPMRPCAIIGDERGTEIGVEDEGQPAIWLPGSFTPYRFENLRLRGSSAARIGLDQNLESRDDACNIWFRHCELRSTVGPTVDLGFCYWIWIEHCLIDHAQGPTPESDLRAAILCKGRNGPGSGLTVEHAVLWGGGIRYYVPQSTWGITVKDVLEEGPFGTEVVPPVVELFDVNPSGRAFIENIALADASAPGQPAAVVIHARPEHANVVTAISCDSVDGPATVLNAPLTNSPVSLWRRHQQGWEGGGKLVGDHDASRRAFGPVAVRFKNLADLGGWAAAHPEFCQAGLPAPDGTHGAVRLQNAENGAVYLQDRTFAEGDYVIGGGWARGGQLGFSVYREGVGDIVREWLWPGHPSDGDWQWSAGCGRVPSAGPGRLGFGINGDGGEFYGLVLLHIPAGTVSDNEAHAIAQHLQSYPPTAEPGDLAIMPGQRVTWAGVTTERPPPPSPSDTTALTIGAVVVGTSTQTGATVTHTTNKASGAWQTSPSSR